MSRIVEVCMSSVWLIIVFVIVWLMSFHSGRSSINGVWENTPIIVLWSDPRSSHPEVPKMRDYGWRDEHEV